MDAALCVASLGALWVLVRLLPGVGVIAPLALAAGTAIVLVSLLDGERTPVILGIPALMLALLLVPGEDERLLVVGIVLAASLAAAAARWIRDGSLAAGRAVGLLAAALGPALALPLGGTGAAAALITGLGAVSIVAVASVAGRVGTDVVAIAFCAALVAPAEPLRASLFPFVVAAMVLVLRRPGPFSAGGFVLLVLLAGKWYLPLLLAVAAGFAVQRLRTRDDGQAAGSPAVAVPFVSGIPAAALATLAVAPDAWSRAKRAGLVATGTACALAAGSLFVQPSLATLYGIAAIACLVAIESNGRWSVVLASFALLMSGLTAWSGALSGAFPLPLPLVVVLLLALVALVGSFRLDGAAPTIHVRSALIAGLAVTLVLLHPALEGPGERVATDLRIARGESVTFPLPAGVDIVRLEMSGGNVAGLPAGVVVGRVRVDDGAPREVRIGEIADWGARRREHFLSADNPQPLEPAGPVFGRGREAFLSGAGVVRIEANGGRSLTIEATPEIGEDGRLLVAAVEVQR